MYRLAFYVFVFFFAATLISALFMHTSWFPVLYTGIFACQGWVSWRDDETIKRLNARLDALLPDREENK